MDRSRGPDRGSQAARGGSCSMGARCFDTRTVVSLGAVGVARPLPTTRMSDFLQKYVDFVRGVVLDYEFDPDHLLMSLGMVALVLLIDLAYTGFRGSALDRILVFDRSARMDLFYYLLDAFKLFSLVSFLVTFGVCYALVGLIQGLWSEPLLPMVNEHVKFVLVFLLSDLKNYVRHYVFHRVDFLWNLHAVHHSATSFTVFTTSRGHFIELEISRFFDVLPLMLLGLPLHTYFLLRFIVQVQQLIIHSSIASDWGWIGRYVLVSPAAHRVHHSIEERHFNRNYASIFIFWDRLFGTYHKAEKVAAIGIPADPYNRGIVRDTVTAVRLSLGTLYRRLSPRR